MHNFSFLVIIFISLFALNSQASVYREIAQLYVTEEKYKGINPSNQADVREMKDYIGNKFMNEAGLVYLSVDNLVANNVPFGSLTCQKKECDSTKIHTAWRDMMVFGYPGDGLRAMQAKK